MASLNLSCRQAVLSVTADHVSDRVIVYMGGASLHLTQQEADQLALQIQRAAQAVRIGSTTAKQYTDALSGKADAADTTTAQTRNIFVTADGGASLSLTQVEARELAASLVDAAEAVYLGATDRVSISQRSRPEIAQEAAA